ncbi:hypothetical protein [Ramlibacter sp.]|uniref:hypothetical protein n=1 Tax=Ramlibacter sp. TaxID=1917967 RepID=UPI003D10361C
MRFLPALLLAAAFAPLAAFAQAPAAAAETRESLDPRKNQKIERIRIEDEGNRIDELRVGGETQSITVQPKGSRLPAYEIRRGDRQRVWNVLAF